MPVKGPTAPHARFCTAMAKAKVSRDHPRSTVIGCSHSPKPWRMPIDTVTIAAPHSSTCVMDRRAGEGVDCIGGTLGAIEYPDDRTGLRGAPCGGAQRRPA